MQHPVLLGRDKWVRFEQRTYTILPRKPSRPVFGEISLTTHYTNGFPTFVHDNRPTTDVFHLEFDGDHAISLSSTPSLVPVNLVRSSGVPALNGQYLVDMLPRNGLSSKTVIFVTDDRQSIPLSGFTDQPDDLLGTSRSPLIQIPPPVLQDPSTVLLPTTHTTDVRALHDNIPVADDGIPSTDTQPKPTAPCPELLARLIVDQRSIFL